MAKYRPSHPVDGLGENSQEVKFESVYVCVPVGIVLCMSVCGSVFVSVCVSLCVLIYVCLSV